MRRILSGCVCLYTDLSHASFLVIRICDPTHLYCSASLISKCQLQLCTRSVASRLMYLLPSCIGLVILNTFSVYFGLLPQQLPLALRSKCRIVCLVELLRVGRHITSLPLLCIATFIYRNQRLRFPLAFCCGYYLTAWVCDYPRQISNSLCQSRTDTKTIQRTPC